MNRDEALRWLAKVEANMIFGKPYRVYIPRETSPGTIITLITSEGQTFLGAVTKAKQDYDKKLK